ncbi:MAG: phosphoribosylformylglycinamidine synthase subunit PurS, partial [Sedimentisphaerales bacterium]|nr:phosphoribosylformylglycinamidine synthase subunit PurS [Sedimentisphaerales bacterium]
MIHRIEVFNKPEYPDVHGDEVRADIKQLGIRTVEAVQSMRVFLVEGEFDGEQLDRIGSELLVDPVTERYQPGRSGAPVGLAQATLIEVHLKPGVTDPVAASAMMAIADMGMIALSIRTARKYIVLGTLNEKQKQLIAQRVLANDCIEDVIFGADEEPPSPHIEPYQLEKITLPITQLDDEGLMALSKKRDMFLNLTEMRTIQEYYRQQNREPSDIELEMLAQTWSEHCVHKTFRGLIELTETDKDGVPQKTTIVDNMLKSLIARATTELDRPWCISVFVDNAGVVDFDDEYGVCFKVETHNHPSAIEPYGGAATGIGGCIRDP